MYVKYDISWLKKCKKRNAQTNMSYRWQLIPKTEYYVENITAFMYWIKVSNLPALADITAH